MEILISWHPKTIPPVSTPPDVDMETAFEKFSQEEVMNRIAPYLK